MRKKTRRELGKLRELAHFFLEDRLCCFCLKPLIDTVTTWAKHGDSNGPKFIARITLHHIDGDHKNDANDNKAACHESCHRRYHANLLHAKRAEMRAA